MPTPPRLPDWRTHLGRELDYLRSARDAAQGLRAGLLTGDRGSFPSQLDDLSAAAAGAAQLRDARRHFRGLWGPVLNLRPDDVTLSRILAVLPTEDRAEFAAVQKQLTELGRDVERLSLLNVGMLRLFRDVIAGVLNPVGANAGTRYNRAGREEGSGMHLWLSFHG